MPACPQSRGLHGGTRITQRGPAHAHAQQGEEQQHEGDDGHEECGQHLGRQRRLLRLQHHRSWMHATEQLHREVNERHQQRRERSHDGRQSGAILRALHRTTQHEIPEHKQPQE
ncbi:MAG: hypothetical protein ACK56F_25240 [bacterium]